MEALRKYLPWFLVVVAAIAIFFLLNQNGKLEDKAIISKERAEVAEKSAKTAAAEATSARTLAADLQSKVDSIAARESLAKANVISIQKKYESIKNRYAAATDEQLQRKISDRFK